MVMSYLWVLMLGLALGFGLLGGGADLGRAALEGARRGLELGISLGGSLCLWSGFGALLEASGLRDALARLLSPLLGRLFPSARQDRLAMGALCGNVTANLLGLGSAATGQGIEAVKRLRELSGGVEAGDEICRLVVLNTASIQLLPTTVAALRGSLGAAAPLDILPGVWGASLLSVSAGLGAAALLAKLWR